MSTEAAPPGAAPATAAPDYGPSDVVERDLPVDETYEAFTGPFYQEVAKRKKQQRDIKAVITADHAQTGLGKTALAVFMAKVLDTTDGGFTADKSTLNVPEFLRMWDRLEPGSAAILDEAEQLDARRAMSSENVDASHKMQTRRVNQVMALLTLPSPKEIDSRIERLADFWINCEIRGRARIYEKKIHRIKQTVYYETVQVVKWPNMDRDPDYRELASKKDSYIEGDQDQWILRKHAQEEKERAVKQAKQEVRDQWINVLKQHGMAGTEIARLPHVDLTSQRVNAIARGE